MNISITFFSEQSHTVKTKIAKVFKVKEAMQSLPKLFSSLWSHNTAVYMKCERKTTNEVDSVIQNISRTLALGHPVNQMRVKYDKSIKETDWKKKKK